MVKEDTWALRYRPFVRSRIRRLSRKCSLITAQDIEDFEQDVILKTLGKPMPVKPLAYLERTCRSVVHDYMRRNIGEKNNTLPLEPWAIDEAAKEAMEAVDLRMESARLATALPVEVRLGFVLGELMGFNDEEIGQFLGRSSAQVRKARSRALQVIREQKSGVC